MPTAAPENAIYELELIPVPALPSTSVELQDTMQNLLVSLPVETHSELTDATRTGESVTQPAEGATTSVEAVTVCELSNTILCPINLTDISVDLVDGRMVLPSSQVPLEPKAIVQTDQPIYTAMSH